MSDLGYRRPNRLIFGLLVITVGVLFTLDNLGYIDGRSLFRWWPVLLVGYGLMNLLGWGRRPPSWIGLFFVLGGGWMLLDVAGLVRWNIWDFWPVLLIAWGVAMIMGRPWVWRVGVHRPGYGGSVGAGGGTVIGAIAEEHESRARERAERLRSKADRVQARAERVRQRAERLQMHAERIHRGEPDNAHFTVDVFMSNVSRSITSQQVEHGSVTALMGGVDVDLRSADLANGRATMDVSLVMGGLNLFVPDDWVVEFQGSPVMGSVDDQSRHPAGEPAGRLLVEGVVLMSSIVIRN
jgi:hypothetical protein